MLQLICHLIGDYILQSDWMAQNKTSKNTAALAHCLTYGLPFLFLTFSPLALLVIVGSHFLIDRFRLARYLVYAKNFIAPLSATTAIKTELFFDGAAYKEFVDGRRVVNKYKWENCKATGYPSETPPFMAVWLLIIADNTLHLFINYLALKYL